MTADFLTNVEVEDQRPEPRSSCNGSIWATCSQLVIWNIYCHDKNPNMNSKMSAGITLKALYEVYRQAL